MSIQMQAIGSVERDPQLHLTQDGTPFTEFSLAVNTKRCQHEALRGRHHHLALLLCLG